MPYQFAVIWFLALAALQAALAWQSADEDRPFPFVLSVLGLVLSGICIGVHLVKGLPGFFA